MTISTIQLFGLDTGIPYWTLPMVLCLFTPLIYFSTLLISGQENMRNEIMAENIDSMAESRDHDQILVLVGDKHVAPVSDELEKYGWNVSRERSRHWYARFERLLTG